MLVDVRRDNPVYCLPGKEEEFKKLSKEINEWKLWKIKRGFYHAALNIHCLLEYTIKEDFPDRKRWWDKDTVFAIIRSSLWRFLRKLWRGRSTGSLLPSTRLRNVGSQRGEDGDGESGGHIWVSRNRSVNILWMRMIQ